MSPGRMSADVGRMSQEIGRKAWLGRILGAGVPRGVGYASRALCVALLVMAVVTPARVDAQQARVRTALDTTLVSVGDRLQLTVTVEHDAAASVVWPDSISLGPFEVLGADLLPSGRSGDLVVTGARFVLAAFELGDLEIPSFDLRLDRPDGSSTTLSTDAYGVTVASVGLDDGGDIRDIKGPLGIPVSVVLLLPWLLLAAAVISLAYWLWRRSRRGDGSSTRRSVLIPRLPHEEAYEALDRLEASRMEERGEVKQYHIAASEIIRTYVEGRFQVYALEMTTGEVMDGLDRVGVTGPVLSEFEGFLRHCDLVKFAKLRPGPEACRQLLARARSLVDATRPQWEAGSTGQGDEAADVEDAMGEAVDVDGATGAEDVEEAEVA